MQIIDDRRALHAIPELEKDLPKTLDYIRLKLAFLSCQVFSPSEGSLCAWFDFGANSAIAFRSDMDALPVTEKTGAPYASQHPGKMHACGHDGHMAMLLELARRLNGRKDMRKNVLLVFQCAEETPGGAKDICDSGVFKKYKVEAIFGVHLWPGIEKGVIASRKNEMLSRICDVTVTVTGKAAHVGKASEGLDAMAAVVEFYNRVTAMEKELPAEILRLLKFGKIQAGAARNVIADQARMEGTLRCFQDDLFHNMRAFLVTLAKELEDSTGCTVDIHMTDGYPTVTNDPELFDKVCAMVPVQQLAEPLMISEDFSWYQRFVPGVFFLLGIGDAPALHANTFDFDESVLLQGVEFYEELIRQYK